MSGGHWDYEAHRLMNAGQNIGEDETVRKRWPTLGKLFVHLCEQLARCEHDMDWDISGDTIIEDDRKFERERICALLEIVMKAAPDDLFPRGKLGTIQAIQERMPDA